MSTTQQSRVDDAAGDSNGHLEPWMRFWQQMMSGMSSAGFYPAGAPHLTNNSVQQLQRIFFDAMAKYCDDFMRSPQFLELMKQSMDQALAFRKQLNQFMAGALQSAQMPTQDDMGEVLKTLHSIENGLLRRVEELSARLDRMEGDRPAKPVPAPTPKARTGKR